MNVDLTLPLKAAVIEHLAGDPLVTAEVPAARIYGINTPAKPIWPFIRYGVPTSVGFEATCWDGSETDVTIHVFAETTNAAAGEDKALEIAGKVAQSMGAFQSAELGVIENRWEQTNLVKDELEADRWHAIVAFSMIVIKKET